MLRFEDRLLKIENKYLHKYEGNKALEKLINKYETYVRFHTSTFIWISIYALIHFLSNYFINRERNLDNPYWYAGLIFSGLMFLFCLFRILYYHFFTKKIVNAFLLNWEEKLKVYENNIG